jgi:hypothetical protein
VLYHAKVDSAAFKRDLRIVVVVDTRTQRYAVLLSTDVELSPMKIYKYYTARFHKKFLFRDAEQFTGLTAGQARAAMPLHNHFNTRLTAVSFARLETPPPPG